MSKTESIPSLALLEWLDTATAKLTVPARERIRGEIRAHFTDAVERHMRDGCTEEKARYAAVIELGDAKSAARRFRRSHLTIAESKMIETLAKPNTWRVAASVLAVVAMWDNSLMFRDSMTPAITASATTATVLVIMLTIIRVFLGRRDWNCANARFLLLFDASTSLVVAAILAIGAYYFLVAATFCQSIPEICLALKLTRIGDVQNEMPPSDLVAS
jgi:hypothetical protein